MPISGITERFLAMLLLLIFPAVYVLLYAKRFQRRRFVAGFFSGAFVTLLLSMLLVSFNDEADFSRLLLLAFLDIWAIIALTTNNFHVGFGIAAVLVVYFALCVQQMTLVQTDHRYTINLKSRIHERRNVQRSERKEYKPVSPDIAVDSEWHTWLTGMHAVRELHNR